MRRIETGDAEVLAWREPVGCGAVLGIPLFLALLALDGFLLAGTGVFAFGDEGWVPTTVGTLLLLAMVSWLVTAGRDWFGRVGLRIDRRARRFTTGAGPLVPIHGRERSLDGVDRLVIGVVFRHRGSRVTGMKHVLSFEGGDGKRVRIGRADGYIAMRAMAEEVGSFLGLDVLDTTRDEPVLLSADRLGKSLREQVGGTIDPAAFPDPPETSALSVAVEQGRIRVDLPPEGSIGCFTAWILVAATGAGALVWFGLDIGKWGPPVFFGAVAAVVLLILLEAIAPARTTLVVTGDHLTIRRRGLFRTREISVAADRVREVTARASSVDVIWDHGRWLFANRRLPAPAAEWIRAALVTALGA